MKDRYRRFSTIRIFEHLVQIGSFLVLAATGLSQKYCNLDISAWLILKLGGIDMVRIIHRAAGILFSSAVTAHVVAGALGVLLGKWQPSMIITKNDLRNTVHNIKYYLGMANLPAASGKYNYKQKFEYWGLLLGGLLMMATGVILWQPIFATRFMTGEIVPLAKLLHSDEALIVFIIITVWHIYNAVFSPEVFPLNTSIFTGYIPRERMINEHLHELAVIEGCSSEEIRNRLQQDAAGSGNEQCNQE